MPYFNDQSFNDTLTNDILSFEQLGPDIFLFVAAKLGLTFHANCLLLTRQTLLP